ncbi:MAG: hypothetical protein E7406_02235 [Ruminococcaceae bacterium]|nr:hypothetical protein [Oscillospiraceae bacterium]
MEIFIKSTKDGTMQPSLYYEATEKNRPLLVGLHTWSYDRFNQETTLLPIVKKHNFNLLLPEFRGCNKRYNPIRFQACGSELAKQDIKDAIDYIVKEFDVDEENIFLFGESGGGHMALLMSAYCPEYFKAVAATVPISNIKEWAEENEEYRDDVISCCEGDEEEMMKRSPISYIDDIAKANLKIFHGKYDPVVPVKQSIGLYNKIVERHPDCRVFLDIFDGKHQTDKVTVWHWLLSQYKDENSKTQVTG